MADISKTSEQSLNNILNKLGVRTQEDVKKEGNKSLFEDPNKTELEKSNLDLNKNATKAERKKKHSFKKITDVREPEKN